MFKKRFKDNLYSLLINIVVGWIFFKLGINKNINKYVYKNILVLKGKGLMFRKFKERVYF